MPDLLTNDDYHTWIRDADDIYTFEDTLKDPAYIDGGDFDLSYSRDMALQAIKDGEIDVYSSYPIYKGVFVSPSYMEAEQYAGGLGGKVYSKRVPLNDVAWIDPTQGQYAPIRELPKPVIKEEPQFTGEIPPYKESNFYKQRQARLKAKENPRQPLKNPKLSDKINYIDMMDDAEKARITSEFNTNLSKSQRKSKNIRKAVGNYYYTAKNNGFNNYEFTGRYLIDDLYR